MDSLVLQRTSSTQGPAYLQLDIVTYSCYQYIQFQEYLENRSPLSLSMNLTESERLLRKEVVLLFVLHPYKIKACMAGSDQNTGTLHGISLACDDWMNACSKWHSTEFKDRLLAFLFDQWVVTVELQFFYCIVNFMLFRRGAVFQEQHFGGHSWLQQEWEMRK